LAVGSWQLAERIIKININRVRRSKSWPQASRLTYQAKKMIKNYFKIAWRNLIKNKAHSTINIVGLSIGMAVAMIIGLWIWDELSYDKDNPNYEKIAQVMQHNTINGEI
jgi:hypothetical protein